MKILCPQCQTVVAGTDIDLASRVAVCRACSEVFPLPAVPGEFAGSFLAVAPPSTLALPVDLPWTDMVDGSTLHGVLSRNRLRALPLLAFALVWNGIVLTILVSMLLSSHPASAAFLVFHACAGLAALYFALRDLMNRTTFSLGPGGFQVRSGPLPELGSRTMPLEDVDGFTAVERESRRRAGPRWTVAVQTRDGRSVPLSLALPGNDQAAYVAARLNHHMTMVRSPTGYRGRR